MTSYSIGYLRDDGDFAILATLNNNDELIPNAAFALMANTLINSLKAATGEKIKKLHREDTPDYVQLK